MTFTIDIADKLSADVARTYGHDAGSGTTVQQHLADYFAAQIFNQVRENIKNVKREEFADAAVDALITEADIRPGVAGAGAGQASVGER